MARDEEHEVKTPPDDKSTARVLGIPVRHLRPPAMRSPPPAPRLSPYDPPGEDPE